MPLAPSLRRRGGLLRLIRMIPFGAVAGAAPLPSSFPKLRARTGQRERARADASDRTVNARPLSRRSLSLAFCGPENSAVPLQARPGRQLVFGAKHRDAPSLPLFLAVLQPSHHTTITFIPVRQLIFLSSFFSIQ